METITMNLYLTMHKLIRKMRNKLTLANQMEENQFQEVAMNDETVLK